MVISFNYDILKYLYEIYDFQVLDGRVQAIAELVQQGYTITLERKIGHQQKEIFATLKSIKDLDRFIQENFPGWQPTPNYSCI